MNLRLNIPSARLLYYAFRLTSTAQNIRCQNLHIVRKQLGNMVKYAVNDDIKTISRTVLRTSRIVSRITGSLDSCIVHCLVAGALLAKRPNLVLHIGFRPGESLTTDGHAWLTLDGTPVLSHDSDEEILSFTKVMELPLSENSTHES